jgi:hypothetical protein
MHTNNDATRTCSKISGVMDQVAMMRFEAWRVVVPDYALQVDPERHGRPSRTIFVAHPRNITIVTEASFKTKD